MKRTVLPLGALLFMIACGDDSTSANYQWAEDTSSSSKTSRHLRRKMRRHPRLSLP